MNRSSEVQTDPTFSALKKARAAMKYGMLAAGIAFGVTAPLAAQDLPLLFVEQDETAMEVGIETYLKDRTNWEIKRNWVGDNSDDLVLTVTGMGGDHDAWITVDTFPSARRGNEIRERSIRIKATLMPSNNLRERVKPGHSKRDDLLEALNNVMNETWAGQAVYVDSDGDVVMMWSINAPRADVPIHPEQVMDALARMSQVLGSNMKNALQGLNLWQNG